MDEDVRFPYLGQKFKTFADFKRELSRYEQETGHIYTISRSVSVASGNKALKGDKAPRFKDEWVYKQATVACKQYGSRPSKSTGIRPTQQ